MAKVCQIIHGPLATYLRKSYGYDNDHDNLVQIFGGFQNYYITTSKHMVCSVAGKLSSNSSRGFFRSNWNFLISHFS